MLNAPAGVGVGACGVGAAALVLLLVLLLGAVLGPVAGCVVVV